MRAKTKPEAGYARPALDPANDAPETAHQRISRPRDWHGALIWSTWPIPIVLEVPSIYHRTIISTSLCSKASERRVQNRTQPFGVTRASGSGTLQQANSNPSLRVG